jgi:dienelactone hydrolase
MQKKKRKHSAGRIVLISIVSLVLVMVCAFFGYTAVYYHADETAEKALADNELVNVEQVSSGEIDFLPVEGSETGLIFYPGGKVEYTAYAPLLKEMAERGTACILLKMPFNLAVLDPDAADGIRESHPEIKEWYIGGHSLGGAMAAVYAAEHEDDFAGALLLGAYETKDVQDTDLDMILIHGSADQVMNLESYEKNRKNLPAGAHEEIIDGGNHSQFGSYGFQKGDGQASISAEEQWEKTAELFDQDKED